MTTGPVLEVRDLRVYYGAARALHGISFDVDEGEVVTIIGGNGAGKSTTLKTVSGVSELLKTVEGEVTFHGRRVEHQPAHRLARMGMAHVPEGRRVFPTSTVEDNLLLGGYCRRRQRKSFGPDLEAVYERFPALRDRRSQPAGLLSGGEQQMLAVSRAMMSRPKLLLCDEPSLGLSPKLVGELFASLEAINKEWDMGMLIVEQNAAIALSIATRGYLLEVGSITRSGDADTLSDSDAVRAAYLGY